MKNASYSVNIEYPNVLYFIHDGNGEAVIMLQNGKAEWL